MKKRWRNSAVSVRRDWNDLFCRNNRQTSCLGSFGSRFFRFFLMTAVLLLTGIAAASGTDTATRSSETPPEPYEDRATAEQPTEKMMHSCSFGMMMIEFTRTYNGWMAFEREGGDHSSLID